MSAAHEVTRLFTAWREGDEASLERLMPLLYDELRQLASRYMRGERSDHTLQATALVNEAYLRLVGSDVSFADRSHFLRIAAQVMRRILVDHAKAKKALKRGGNQHPVTLDESVLASDDAPEVVLEVDEALQRLAEHDERKSKVVELFYFGGLSYEESAAALGISEATVHRDLRFAKAWLHKEIEAQRRGGSETAGSA
ncbi:MAG: sigma-70 family RNA polymerase sigma factor [Gemmatimonadota bacterium]|nr:sigma-70 family RNA polymerase sigma factor [Gemmatimonadota bacterium]